jgi:HEAT repeat protein
MLLLGITHSHIAINILFQALEDRDYSVRWFTTEALGQIVSEATIPGLRRAIQDEDNEVRWAAFNALEKIGTEAIIPPLIQASKDENTMICEQAIYLLGDIAGEAAIPYLIEALAKEDNSVRGSALCILGQICGKNTIPELIQDLEDRGFDVHSSAFSVIRRWRGIAFFTRPSITYCRLGYSNTISSYAKRMCQKDTIPVLCQKLADEDPDVRKTAVYMLGQIGTDEAIHALCQALDNKDPIVCRDAVHWLGQVHRETGTKTVFPCLLQALEHEDSDVRGYASYVLEQMGIPELLPNLFEMELTAANNIYGILETISAIQGRCKYYNQVIATSPPPQEENNAKPLTVPLDMQEYEDILAVIFNMALVMERCPEAFRRMDEEALRQHFLVQLNGKYKGQSAGEIFNKKGKTDILIRVDGKNIFIAECKFWRGKNNLKETLDQLLGYTTWRDTKLALLIFNRNKNFSAVLEQISEVMKNHPTFTQELSYPSETGFRFILHHPEDKNRELLLTVLAFEIPRSH